MLYPYPVLYKVEGHPAEWFTKGLYVSRLHKDKLHRKFRIKRNNNSWIKYTEYRKVYNRVIKYAKYSYYNTEFSKISATLGKHGVSLIQ